MILNALKFTEDHGFHRIPCKCAFFTIWPVSQKWPCNHELGWSLLTSNICLYQIILFGDRGSGVQADCVTVLCSSGLARSLNLCQCRHKYATMLLCYHVTKSMWYIYPDILRELYHFMHCQIAAFSCRLVTNN